jgi:hypothetical protein
MFDIYTNKWKSLSNITIHLSKQLSHLPTPQCYAMEGMGNIPIAQSIN